MLDGGRSDKDALLVVVVDTGEGDGYRLGERNSHFPLSL